MRLASAEGSGSKKRHKTTLAVAGSPTRKASSPKSLSLVRSTRISV